MIGRCSILLCRVHSWPRGSTSAIKNTGTPITHATALNGSSSTLKEAIERTQGYCPPTPPSIHVPKLGYHSEVHYYPHSHFQSHFSETLLGGEPGYEVESSESLSKGTDFIYNSMWRSSSLRVLSKTVEVMKGN